ncbi:hypothetical protein [Leuconostoc pseudomesenteroides]|uniref:hypothetical protein n=1 Tax=Leuconostoc pseudomesenteroides TaxID=33968 RepID=UPI0032E02A12
MSKLKSALLLSVALSPIFVSATRGIEVVHAEVVKNAVSRQIQKAAAVKPVKATDKKSNTVTATRQDDSDATDLNKADSSAKKSDVIAFDDKNFVEKFKNTDYYKQQVGMYGVDKPSDDANLAAHTASYIATVIGEKFFSSKDNPVLMKALGFAGPVGFFVNCLIDWLTPAARNETNEKLQALSDKIGALGIHLDNVGQAIGDKVSQAVVENRLEAFKTSLNNTREPFGTLAGKIIQYQSGHNSTLDSTNQNDVNEYVDDYGDLYRTKTYGFDEKKNEVVEDKPENLKAFNDFCKFGEQIVSADFNEDNIFRVMSNYEPLKEFFNTQTFATREAFAEYVISQYTVGASDMMTAIMFDYNRVKGQLDEITKSDAYQKSVAAAKTNHTTVDSEFDKNYHISYRLFDKLRSNARQDLMRLGFDVSLNNGNNNSYDLDEYTKNNWAYKYNNNSVHVNTLPDTNILGANVNAVSYAYAKEVENKPVKTVTPEYAARLAAAQKKYDQAKATLDKVRVYGDPNLTIPALKAFGYAEAELKQLKNNPEYGDDKVLEDEKGVPLPGKLKAEEKTSNDGKIIYSYRNNKWVYSQLVSGQAAYAAKHMVEKNDLEKIKNMCKGPDVSDGYFFATCWQYNSDLPNNPSWNKAYENAMSSKDVDCLNTNAAMRHRGGINTVLTNTVTREVNGIQMLGFDGLGKKNRVIGDKDYNFTGDKASIMYAPTFNIGLGYYQNDTHNDPSDKQKTVYQNFYYFGTTASFNKDGSYAGGKQSYNDKSYDQNDVTFIKLVKDGDNELDALNNGKKTPVAPDHFVE